MQSSDLSITGKRWALRNADYSQAVRLSQSLGVSEVVGHILSGRKIGTGENGVAEALTFLAPKLSDMPDPMHLKGMKEAVERIVIALEKKQKIAVFGDYDVDGSCASALLLRYFDKLGNDAILYIPDRLSEGYGPNPLAMQRLKEQGADLIITVDCGSLAFDAFDEAAKLGMDVIITDHHQTKPDHPKCVALVNPNRIDETSECTMLAGVGVAFYLVMALNRVLREKGYFTKDMPEPALKELLDLVALATICDMVPLTGVNRVLVDRGLKVASTRQNLGIKALAHASRSDAMLNTYAAGFQLGPRINAGGRISECTLGARLLSMKENDKAQALAIRLDALNEERKAIEQQVLEEAMIQAEQNFSEDNKSVVVAGEGWHPGVVGIVASRIKEKFHRPTFVMSIEDGKCKGSGRSVSGIDLGRAVIDSGDILISGGGHAMAAGVTLELDNLDKFKQALDAHVEKQVGANTQQIFTPKLSLDGFLSPASVNDSFMQTMSKLEPFGAGNPEPKFIFSGVIVSYIKQVGADGSHLQVSFKGQDGMTLQGIAFRAMNSELGPFLLDSRGKQPITICGVLRQETWNGQTRTKIQIHDARPGIWKV